ncbi:MAG: cation transporter, partial [Chitinophagales bacterium]|nr:cation transporter [Chitinophagales bacterium]
LMVVTCFMIYETLSQFKKPKVSVTIYSFVVAVFGLLINGLSAYVLHREEEKMDVNIYAAYLHVLSDVVLSCFALISLTVVYFMPVAAWIDSVLGLAGSLIIMRWGVGLIRKSFHDALS